METEPLYQLFNIHLYKNRDSLVVTDANPDGKKKSPVDLFGMVGDSSFVTNNITSGSVAGNLEYAGGYIQSANYIPGTSGWQLNSDGNLYAVNATLSGSISAVSGTIGAFTIGADYIKDVADSFGLASTVTGSDDVRIWAGDTYANRATADFRVTEAGAVTASSITITGGSISGVPISSIPNSSATDISLLEKTHNIVFSVTDADTIAWSSGTIVLSNGRTFSISAGNTGNMSALTYIYLDPATSTTVLQTTTTYSTAMGANKTLMGTAQNHTVTASFIPYGAGQPLIDGANIGALSIVAGNIAASTITAGKLSVSQLSAITADLGSITAGSITINSGVASISSAGAAVFKSIQVGGSTVQYTLNDSGIYSYGDGSDGALVTSGNVTLTADKYYTDLTISTGDTFDPAGYRIFVSGTLTIQGTGKIARNGNNGSNGSNASGSAGANGGAGAAALADGYLKGSVAGSAGGRGSNGDSTNISGNPVIDNTSRTGVAGTATTNSIGSDGTAGATGGSGGNGANGGGAGGAGGVATQSNVKLIANWHLATLLDVSSSGSTVKYDNSAGCGGGGGGSGGASSGTYNTGTGGGGGGGGGSGSNGGILAIYARVIVIGASGRIEALGGTGGNGGNGAAGQADGGGANASGGGGGAGGTGGEGGNIILVYNSLTNSGTISVAGGSGGTGGSGGAGLGTGIAGASGSTGTTGGSGIIRQFNLSL